VTKQLLDKVSLEVLLKGLPRHCCLFRGLETPPLEQHYVALEGLKGIETSDFS
jgi:hypothetical protein